MPRLGEVLAALDGWYDPRWAEAWDAVGLVCGDPAEPVRRIVLAVDAVPATVAEALDADLLITHHPLLLTGVHGVPADDPKGALVHRLIRAGTAHFVAHTNADVAAPGVSDALADLLGLRDTRPLEPQLDSAAAKLVVYVPVSDAQRLFDALAAAGAGQIGNYERCAWTTTGVGTFRALLGANPTLGEVGEIETVDEARVEMIVPSRRSLQVLAALRAAHPYEEPAFDLLTMAPLPTGRGTGRVGQVPATTLREFVASAAAVLPPTVQGVRAAGAPDQQVSTVAVCGGSGGGYAELARASGADAYLTADLKHHATSEAVTERGAGMALIDAAHWATEAPWLEVLADRLRGEFGTTVEVAVSRLRTDPWTLHVPSPVQKAISES